MVNKHIFKCLSLQGDTITAYCQKFCSLIISRVGSNVKQMGLSYTAVGSVNQEPDATEEKN